MIRSCKTVTFAKFTTSSKSLMTLTFIAAGYIETGRVQVTVIYTIVAFIDVYNANKYVHIYILFTNIDALALFTEPFTSAVLGLGPLQVILSLG